MASNSSIKTIRDGQCNHFLNTVLSVQPLMNQNSSSKHTLHATFFVANKGDIPYFREYRYSKFGNCHTVSWFFSRTTSALLWNNLWGLERYGVGQEAVQQEQLPFRFSFHLLNQTPRFFVLNKEHNHPSKALWACALLFQPPKVCHRWIFAVPSSIANLKCSHHIYM